MKTYLNHSAKIAFGSFATIYGLTILGIMSYCNQQNILQHAKQESITANTIHHNIRATQYIFGTIAGVGIVSLGLGINGQRKIRIRRRRMRVTAFTSQSNEHQRS